MNRILILGSGSWGSALSFVLLTNKIPVMLYGKDKEQIERMKKTHTNPLFFPDIKLDGDIEFTSDLVEAYKKSKIIVNAIPTQFIRSAFETIPKEFLEEKKYILNASKGIELKTLKRISEIIASFTPNSVYAVLSGPSHAEEVILSYPTAILAASKDKDFLLNIQEIFMNKYFRIYTSDDVLGVELCGAFKNSIAIAAGMIEGLGYGDNTIAALITRGMVELKRLGLKLGAKSSTYDGLSGIGDMIVTCTSKHSRNRRFGYYLAKGESVRQALEKTGGVVEGLATLEAVNELSSKIGVDMPINEALKLVIDGKISAKEALFSLMNREKKPEIESF